MCGIVGAVDLKGSIDPARIHAMADAIPHRGPDGDGFYVAGSVGIGMRRLSIIDLAGGDQPISNEDGTLQIVYNGEMYNYLELQDQLRARGHHLATNSDTETIPHLYEDYDLNLFEHLRGMYAFAMWDAKRNRLILAVDHIGIKPLYVYQNGSLLLFASEVKALFAYGAEVPRELNLPALDTYMSYGFMVGQETLFTGIRRLAPGTALIIENGTVREITHWKPDYQESSYNSAWREADYVQQVRETLEEAVKIHLRSDVPLGLFLSGGVDSAGLLAMMSHYEPGRIKTFTVGYLDGSHRDNELDAARQTAQVFNSDHHEMTLTAADWWNFMCQYVYAHDEPNANPSAVSLLALSKLTAESVKVVLNGIGSDELFAGYNTHRDLPIALQRAETLHKLIPGSLRRGLRSGFDELERLYPTFSRYRGFGALPHSLPPIYHHLDDLEDHLRRTLSYDGTVFSSAARLRLFADNQPTGRAKTVFHSLLDSAPTHQPQNLLHYLIMSLWLPGNGLLSADKVSMAYSLEARVPYFDRRLMEVAIAAPPEIRTRQNKILLRAALDGVLPQVIRERAKKGFGTPIQAWFSGVLKGRLKEVLYDSGALNRPYFRRTAMVTLLDNHFAGRTSQPEMIWRLLNLELWHRAFLDTR